MREAGNGSQLLEASLLQNIGATYNEKLMYSESLVYHREAATIHGKIAYIHSGFEGYDGKSSDLHVYAGEILLKRLLTTLFQH